MLVYFSFLIPVICTIILYVFFKRKIVWWEIAVLYGVSILFVLCAKGLSIMSLTGDREWWGGYVTDARYYEPWDEEVPCRHEIPCSHTKTCTDDKGKSYDCGYEHSNDGYYHAYDVDYHSEYWVAVTTLGDYGISKKRYNELVKQFGTEVKFVDMHRDFHSIDGDQYRCDWGGEDATLEPVAEVHSYENRPMASHSIYEYQALDTFDIKTYKPFEYPEIYNQFHQDVLLGYNDPAAERRLQVINSRLGSTKQIRVYFLIFRTNDRETGFMQERHWQGGNKNEIVVCIGLDNQNHVKWGHTFSWTEQTEVKIKIKQSIEDMEQFDINKVIDMTNTVIQNNWVRKPFHEFDYLTIQPTMTQVVWIVILTLLINGGLCYWIIVNEFEVDKNGKPTTRW